MTTISKIELTYVRAPLDKPVNAFGMVFSHRDYLLAELHGDGGEYGIGFSYVGVGGGKSALYAANDLLAHHVIGKNADDIESIWQSMYNATLIQGRAGIVMNAISAIDIGLWDMKARRLNQPLASLFGGDYSKPIRAYASGGYYADDKDIEGLKDEIRWWKELGFTAIKIKAGKGSLKHEEARIMAVRDVIGDDALVMIDLYNAMENLGQAVRYTEMFEQYQPYWLEDPFKGDDIDSFIRLSQRTAVPLATGEFHYSPYTFRNILEQGAAQIIQHEAPRVGGISQWRRIAHLVSGYSATVNPCWFHQLHAHLIPSTPGAEFVEYFPDTSVLNFDNLIQDNQAQMKDGHIHLTDSPGVGFNFNHDRINSYEHEQIVITA